MPSRLRSAVGKPSTPCNNNHRCFGREGVTHNNNGTVLDWTLFPLINSCCQQKMSSTVSLGFLELGLHQTYFSSTIIHNNRLCPVQSYLPSRYQRPASNASTIIHINSLCPVQSYLSNRFRQSSLSSFQRTMAFSSHPDALMPLAIGAGVLYLLMGVLTANWLWHRSRRDAAQDECCCFFPCRLPRCFSDGYLRWPLWVISSLVWPPFWIFMFLKSIVDLFRPRSRVPDEENAQQ